MFTARERDRGTLEVLFYGPVDEIAYILGLFMAQIKIYLLSILITLLWLNLVTWLLHLAFSIDIFLVLLTSVVVAGVVIAFGLLTAVWGGRTRTALVYYLLVVFLFVGLQIADQTVSNLVLAANPTINDPLLLIRNVLNGISDITQWVSPYAQLNQVIDAIMQRMPGDYLGHLAVLVSQLAIMLYGSFFILRRKGVRG